jgi:hypothetical protein
VYVFLISVLIWDILAGITADSKAFVIIGPKLLVPTRRLAGEKGRKRKSSHPSYFLRVGRHGRRRICFSDFCDQTDGVSARSYQQVLQERKHSTDVMATVICCSTPHIFLGEPGGFDKDAGKGLITRTPPPPFVGSAHDYERFVFSHGPEVVGG